jgi:hypothetical protein
MWGNSVGNETGLQAKVNQVAKNHLLDSLGFTYVISLVHLMQTFRRPAAENRVVENRRP